MDARSWQDNASEFRGLDLGEGWPFAVLVACSVDYRPGDNTRPTGPESLVTGKVSAQRFAGPAGCGEDRIKDYFKAWELAADADVVPHARDLKPESVSSIRLPDNIEHPWSKYSRKAREWRDAPGKSYERTANGNPERLVAAMSEEQREAVVKEIVQVSDADVVREVHRVARDRIISDHPGLEDAQRAAREREASDRRERRTVRFLDANGRLATATRALREALAIAQEVQFNDDERDVLITSAGRARSVADLVLLALRGSTDVDWDAELARIGGVA